MLDRHYHIAQMPQIEESVSDLEALYVKATQLRDFEITQLVQRNNFFMIFQGVLLAGVLQSEGKVLFVTAAVCLLGAIISVAQYRMAAGAKYWQQRWESELIQTEAALKVHYGTSKKIWLRDLFDGVDADSKVKFGFKKHGWITRVTIDKIILDKPSVSRIPIYVGMILCAAWLVLAACFLVRGWSI